MNYNNILERIRPKPEEMKKNKDVSKRIMNEINKTGYEAVLVGSSARGTFLTGSHDLDIFVFFPKNLPKEKLEEAGIKLGKEVLKNYHPMVHYAEHPYVKGIIDGVDVEVVPCYKIKRGERIISAVDRSPLHNEYMQKEILGLEDQVLLMKQFMKAQKCYGAEQRVEGFSGILVEFLIVKYKSFDNAIKEIAEWGTKIIINGVPKQKYKFQDQLIVIDPVDETRNMAAAVSRKTLSRLILTARKFLKQPSEDFFFPKKIQLDLKKELKRNIIMVLFQYPGTVIEEIIWGQLKKLSGTLKDKLNEEGFGAMKSFYWTDEKQNCALIYELESVILSKYKKHKGPEIFEQEHAGKFIEKHGEVWVERNTLYTWQKRKIVTASEFLINLLTELELPSHLEKVARRAKILQGRELKRYPQIVEEYFDDIMRFEAVKEDATLMERVSNKMARMMHQQK